MEILLLILLCVFQNGYSFAVEANKSVRLGDGIPITQQEFDLGKYSSWSVGSTIDEDGKTCLAVKLSSNFLIMSVGCARNGIVASFGSISPIQSTSGSPGVREKYTLNVGSSPVGVIIAGLEPDASNPPKSKAVPVILPPSTGATLPPGGQICQVYGFSDGSLQGAMILNRREVVVINGEACDGIYAINQKPGLVDSSKHFCAYLSSANGDGSACEKDMFGPIFCKKWGLGSRRRIFFFSKDDEDDELEEDSWVFAGFFEKDVGNSDNCGQHDTLPRIFRFFNP